jgi:non-canonical purine NTP pyrophosphatase (RdgB/HAM1 family)
MLYFITGSQGKFREAKSIIPELEQLDIDLIEIQSIDAKEVIEAKLREARVHKDGNIIVEDTSLYLNNLNGLPGPLIKWFMKTIGNEGLAEIAQKVGSDNTAIAKTIIGYLDGTKISFFEGNISGKIVSPRGENGFGWDAIFEPEGSKKTFAEMSDEEKNSISMRKIAFKRLEDFIKK